MEVTYSNIGIGDIRTFIQDKKNAAWIGSRSIKKRNDVCEFVVLASSVSCYTDGCKVISGGAYGADQSAMEGALDMRAGDLDPVIPISSRKTDRFVRLVKDISDINMQINENDAVIFCDTLSVFYPDFSDGYSPHKYKVRDRKMVDVSEGVIAFWDGKSRGTAYTVDYAKNSGKDVLVIVVPI